MVLAEELRRRSRNTCQQAGNPNNTPATVDDGDDKQPNWRLPRRVLEGEETAGPCSERDTAGSADRGEQEALAQHLTDQVTRFGAERFANRHFVATLHHARQKEMREIGAGHQEHQSDGGPGEQQRRANVASDFLRQRNHVCADSCVCIGIGLREAVSDGLDFGLSLFRGYARFQARHDFEGMAFTVVLQIGLHQRERHPEVGPLGKCLPARDDADDGERLIGETNLTGPQWQDRRRTYDAKGFR